MNQFALLMRFLFAGEDSYYLQQKKRNENEKVNVPLKREIIWSKTQAGKSAYLKKTVIERN